MAEPVIKRDNSEAAKSTEQTTEKSTLKGTFVSVMILGGFLLLSWLLVFMLFLSRQ